MEILDSLNIFIALIRQIVSFSFLTILQCGIKNSTVFNTKQISKKTNDLNVSLIK